MTTVSQEAREVTQEDAWRRFELWLFRECNEGTRRHLWAMFGLPIDEISNHGRERYALRYVKNALAHRHQAERETLARMEWQPIETAPKNPAGEMLGPTILIYYDADGLPWPAYWGPCIGALSEGSWILADPDASPSAFRTEDVTHWMPLPPAPEAAA